MAEPSPALLDWSDFLALDEDDPRELVDGKLISVDMSTKLHEWIVTCLAYHLTAWARRNGGLPLVSG